MTIGNSKIARINTVYGGGGHIVVLGAGASLASSLRNPLANGMKVPLMKNFTQIVGLDNIISGLPSNLKSINFELLYSNLFQDDPDSSEIKEIEKRVYDYFKQMRLPEVPTIYDYLVLSLRSRDLIATFNWDPFLYQAWNRNKHVGDFPYIAFLHGNVSIGYNEIDKRSGPAGMYSKDTKNLMHPTKLLFPVSQKDYNKDEYTASQWDLFKSFLSDKAVKLVTVFGYGAPETDVVAVKTMLDSWGGGKVRNMEQFEIIDVRKEKAVTRQWAKFIESHHYDYSTNYFESSLAYNPRRTSESYFQHIEPFTEEEAFSESNPVPTDFKTLEELWSWHQPLIDAENRSKESKPKAK